MTNAVIFTIGHSNHTLQHFLKLLASHQVTAIADVRSSPYSGYNPQFNQDPLSRSLKDAGISYVFVGEELGARPADLGCYTEGRVSYQKLMSTETFRSGIDRVVKGAQQYRVALMCSEKDPLQCHRGILVGKALEAAGLEIHHICADGGLESNASAMDRLLDVVGLPRQDMFRSRQELIEEACTLQEREIAFSESDRAG